MDFLQRALRNWRTTVMGVGSIMTGLGDLMAQLGNGHFQSEQLGPDITAILLGMGFLFARDSVVSEHEHRAESMARAEVAEKVEETRAVVAEKLAEVNAVDQARVQEQIKELHAE